MMNELDMILDIPVQMAVELGRTKITIKNLLQLADVYKRQPHGRDQMQHLRAGGIGGKRALDGGDLPGNAAHARDEIGIGTREMPHRHTP